MQLFNLLKQAQQNGPNESDRALPENHGHVRRDSHVDSKDADEEAM